MKTVIFLMAIVILISFAPVVYGQNSDDSGDYPHWVESLNQPKHQAPNPRLDLRPKEADGDWQAMIDEVWGWDLSGAEQWTIFSDWILELEENFACFINHDVQVLGYYWEYQAELQAGVSSGRFQAILDKVNLDLQNGHTYLKNTLVTETIPAPGVPLLMGRHYNTNDHFGACLTFGDEGVFVYDVVEDHPLGLEVGDIILGYDDQPWSELYPELLDAGLPVGDYWHTSDASFEYAWEAAAGNNWHLFETIDILKFSTGEIQHLPTILMVDSGVDLSVYCNDQLNRYLPHPTAPSWTNWDIMTLGGKRFGLIRCDAWLYSTGPVWEQACLDMVNDPDLEGLVIDFRNNVGGWANQSNGGLGHLFNEEVLTIDTAFRDDSGDHLSLQRVGQTFLHKIPGDPADFFDKPIAVLIGPKTISSGDQVALRMTYHPMVRTFGRPTSATFDQPNDYHVNGQDEFSGSYSTKNMGRIELPDEYLSSLGFPVDQEVWLTPEDCRNGLDTVLIEAINWIYPLSDVPEDNITSSRFTSVSPNPSNPQTVIKFQLEASGPCRLEIFDIAGHLVRSNEWSYLAEGSHNYRWNGKTGSGQNAASGLYMLRLTAQDKVDGARFSLVR